VKFFKIFAIGLVALALLLGGAAAYLRATFDAARIKQEIASAVERQSGRSLRIEGELALGFWPDIAIHVGRSSLSERSGTEEFARLDSVRIAVAALPLLSGQVVAKQVEVAGLKATLIKRKDGTLNIADLTGIGAAQEKKVGAGEAPPVGAAPIALPALDIAALRFSDAELLWRDEATGRSSQLFASIDVRGITGWQTELKLQEFALDTTLQADTSQIKLQLTTPIALDLAKQTLTLKQLNGTAKIASPALLQPLALSLTGAAQADLAQQSASLDLITRFDATTIKAQATVGPVADFAIDIDQIDINKYLPPASKGAAGKAETAASGAAADPRIDLAFLKGLNFKGTAHIGRLDAPGFKASDIRFTAIAQGGRLNIAPLTANLYQGRLAGSLAAAADDNRISVQQQLDDVEIEPLLKDLANKDMLAGRGQLVLNVTGQGDSVAALKKSLAGTARLALRDGAIKGIDIGAQLRDIKALLAGGKDQAVATDAARQTDFSELTASFRIARGVARNDDLTAKSPLLRLSGAGDIDIGNHRLDYLLKTSLVATATGQGGKERDQVSGITLPVRLRGSLDQPAWNIEIAELAGSAAKAKFAEKKEEIRQQAEDQLKDKLRGLFGR
jgi:AsmA protein